MINPEFPSGREFHRLRREMKEKRGGGRRGGKEELQKRARGSKGKRERRVGKYGSKEGQTYNRTNV